MSAGLVELGEEVKLTEVSYNMLTGGPVLTSLLPCQADQSKIKAIRWLVYDEVHRTEAIRQSNALIRQFLGKLYTMQCTYPPVPW